MDPRLISFVELVSVGWHPARAASVVGVSTDRAEVIQLMRQPEIVRMLSLLRSAADRVIRHYGFAAIALRTGSLSTAYRETFCVDGLSSSAIRARASRIVRGPSSQLALIKLSRCLAPTLVHGRIEPILRRVTQDKRQWDMCDGFSHKGMSARAGLGSSTKTNAPDGRQRCGARTRSPDGAPCKSKVVKDSARCRLHGGLSTGPRTPEGKQRCIQGVRKHFEAMRQL